MERDDAIKMRNDVEKMSEKIGEKVGVVIGKIWKSPLRIIYFLSCFLFFGLIAFFYSMWKGNKKA